MWAELWGGPKNSWVYEIPAHMISVKLAGVSGGYKRTRVVLRNGSTVFQWVEARDGE